MKKYYLVQNAIVRKESFGVIVLLRNGARFSFAQKYFDIIKSCTGQSLEYIKSNTKLEENEILDFLKLALEKHIIQDKPPKSIGKIIETDVFVENSLISPRFVALEITQKCNLKCKHCYTSSKATNYKFLSKKAVFSLIDDLSTFGTEFIAIGGGEPILYPYIYEVIDYATSKNIEIELVSNGTLLTEETLKKLKDAGLKYLQISLDGESKETYRKIRGVDCFSQVVDNINKATALFNVSVSAVLCKPNYEHIYEIAKIAENANADSFRVLRLMSVGRGEENNDELQITNEMFGKFLNSLPEKQKEFKIKIRIDENMLSNFSRKKIPWLKDGLFGCSAGRSTIGIDPLGNVYPCSFLHYDELTCGNISEKSIMEIWRHSPILSKFRNINSLEGKCAGCSFKNNCLGGCRALAYSATRKINGEDASCHIK